MKKIIFFACVMFFSLSASTVFANNTESNSISKNTTVPDKKENRLSDEEMSRLTKRVEEIRNMDKTNLTFKEKRVLRKELREIKEKVKKSGDVVYIGTGTLILIIILVILLV